MEKFMQCMKDHDGVHMHCHQQTKVNALLLARPCPTRFSSSYPPKDYLACRMEKDLMKKEVVFILVLYIRFLSSLYTHPLLRT